METAPVQCIEAKGNAGFDDTIIVATIFDAIVEMIVRWRRPHYGSRHIALPSLQIHRMEPMRKCPG